MPEVLREGGGRGGGIPPTRSRPTPAHQVSLPRSERAKRAAKGPTEEAPHLLEVRVFAGRFMESVRVPSGTRARPSSRKSFQKVRYATKVFLVA